ncbi:MAG: NADPH:quinone oxidoreductase family protein [Burkholderiales bacterium]|mgnify:FL=1|nr:alcohol dehydrogenase [Rhodocyclaceae bacterium]MCQ3923101.1 NADPH:quinone oxidoreductase family protein [Rhodocyclaceae bacterium]MCZ2419334.1 NADPH:quinone oxidoreductase family protein [Burkholderiales bacterium]HNQ56908.1 NADPH:quinone oxidoreductase family protein [Candidatus Desulfobacillus denitrificans]HNT63975.1 NADPH:quinone oxidoreductase family protein [Candidatus Desulfobacillus denitrificans]
MKALLCAEYGPLEKLAVEDMPSPTAGPGQVVVDVKAAALNFPDALMVQGLYQVKPPLPFSPGAEVAGLVKAVGQGVQGLKAGDRVIGFPGTGGFAEECAVAAGKIMPLPENMDFATGAALVLTYGTSLHALQDCGRLQPGETLLVLGAAGGIGAAAVEIGKAMGARVIAAASNGDKLALCRQLGADETINYSREELRQRALALTGEKGVDVVCDPVGGGYTEPALRALAWRGRLLIVGFAAGEIPKIPLNLALLKERSLIGVYWGDSVRHDPRGHMRNMQQLMAWFAEGKVRPVVSERFPLARAPEAMRRLLDRQVKGKVVILPE